MGKLSGRMIHNHIDSMAPGAQVVILNEQGKGGMLQSLGVTEGSIGPATIKIEVDGVTIFQGPNIELFLGKVFNGSQSYLAHGTPLLSAFSSSSTPTAIANRQRVFNLPFVDSLKITVSNSTASHIMALCIADYVIEV